MADTDESDGASNHSRYDSDDGDYINEEPDDIEIATGENEASVNENSAHVAELPGGQIPGDRGESKENEKTDEEMAIIGKDFVFENDARKLKPNTWSYKLGIKEHLPLITKLSDMYEDIVTKCLAFDKDDGRQFETWAKKRQIRVATMCSGTESPILALKALTKCLSDKDVTLSVEHVFSVEIDPQKQAYIERNFAPPILFRDVVEFSHPFKNKHATTAYGQLAPVPGNIDILVAGASCVDNSSLNAKTKKIDEMGESGKTLHGVLSYMNEYRPKVVIFENTRLGGYWTAIEHNLLPSIGYIGEKHAVDTKNYYIPQTRTRSYMLAIDITKLDESRSRVHSSSAKVEAANILFEWHALMTNFQRPASSPMGDFLLENDDPYLLHGLAEYEKERQVSEKTRDWIKGQILHLAYPNDLGLGYEHPITGWRPGGFIKVDDAIFREWLARMVDRVKDLIDLSYKRGAQSGYDERFMARAVDVSQAIDRGGQDLSAAGIISCLTPDGIAFLTREGRPAIALEYLAMQGLPAKSLNFARESQNDLKDLAGNAMTSTVVGVACISTLMAVLKSRRPELQVGRIVSDDSGDSPTAPKEDEEFPDSHLDEQPSASNHSSSLTAHESDEEFSDGHLDEQPSASKATGLISTEEIAHAARCSVRFCVGCERYGITSKNTMYRCKNCGHTYCQKCDTTGKHHHKAIPDMLRNDPSVFRKLVKSKLPMNLRISPIPAQDLKPIYNNFSPDCYPEADPLPPQLKPRTLQLQEEMAAVKAERSKGKKKKAHEKAVLDDKKRQTELKAEFQNTYLTKLKGLEDGLELRYCSTDRTDIWVIRYESEHIRLDLVCTPSGASMHVQLQWLLYLKPCATEPGNSLARSTFKQPILRMTPGDDLLHGHWEVWNYASSKSKDLPVTILPSTEQTSTFRSDLGLLEHLGMSTPSSYTLVFRPEDAKKFGLEPSQSYKSVKCGDVAERSLFVCDSTNTWAKFMFLEVGHYSDPVDNYFVVSSNCRRLRHSETRRDTIRFPKTWRPEILDTEKGSNHSPRPIKINLIIDGEWTKCPSTVELGRDLRHSSVVSHASLEIVNSVAEHSCNHYHDVVQIKFSLPMSNAEQWAKMGAIPEIDQKEFFEYFASVIENHCEVSGLDEWNMVVMTDDQCFKCAPSPPDILWTWKQTSNKISPYQLVPFENRQQAATYERAIKERPAPFRIQLLSHSSTLVFSFNPIALLHRLAARFTKPSKVEDILFSWRLDTTDDVSTVPRILPLKLTNNEVDPEAFNLRGFKQNFVLRSDQLRSVWWMLEQENRAKKFLEQEVIEALIPGIGWRAEARAVKEVDCRGGVIADDVGYGKTVTTLALIAEQRHTWPINHNPDPFRVSTHASLVLVPPHLVSQWESESYKFLNKSFKILVVASLKALENIFVDDFVEADVIIAPWDLLESPEYLSRIAYLAGAPLAPTESGSTIRARKAWYKSATDAIAKNIELLSRDPLELYEANSERYERTLNDIKHQEMDVPNNQRNSFAHGQAQRDLDNANTAADEAKYRVQQVKIVLKNAEIAVQTVKAQVTQISEAGQGNDNLTNDEATEGQVAPSAQVVQVDADIDDMKDAVTAKVNAEEALRNAEDALKRAEKNVGDAQVLLTYYEDDVKNSGDYDRNIREWDFFDLKMMTNRQNQAEMDGAAKKALHCFMRHPLFEMFKFQRIVVDEYAYLQGDKSFIIKSLVSDSRWILCATPKIQNFADVKKMASLVGVHLGIDDISPGFVRPDNIKDFEKDKTNAEQFKSYQPPPSTRWHSMRHEQAQLFLAEFVRKNHTRPGDIAMSKHIIPVDVSIAERVVYTELVNALSANNFTLKTPFKPKAENDRAKRVNALLKGSIDATDALMRCVTYLNHAGTNKKEENLSSIIETRRAAIDALEETIKKLLRKVVWLNSNNKGEQCQLYLSFRDCVRDNLHGDLEFGRRMITWVKYYETIVKDKTYAENLQLWLGSDSPAKIGSPRDNQTRKHVTELQVAVDDMVDTKRSLRLCEKLQHLETKPKGSTLPSEVCDTCKRSVSAQDIHILSSCGHLVCDRCLPSESGKCPVGTCRELYTQIQMVKISDFELHKTPPPEENGVYLGAKLEKVIELLKKIPDDDRAILFVQSKTSSQAIFEALKKRKISIQHIKNDVKSDKNKALHLELTDSQNRTGSGAPKPVYKVLMLEIGSVGSAGLNLIDFNHLFYISPYVAPTIQDYQDAMNQALGRAYRTGQTKRVHVYHFLSLRTIDVDIIQKRHGRVLTRAEVDTPALENLPHPAFKPANMKLLKGGDRGEFASAAQAWGTLALTDEDDDLVERRFVDDEWFDNTEINRSAPRAGQSVSRLAAPGVKDDPTKLPPARYLPVRKNRPVKIVVKKPVLKKPAPRKPFGTTNAANKPDDNGDDSDGDDYPAAPRPGGRKKPKSKLSGQCRPLKHKANETTEWVRQKDDGSWERLCKGCKKWLPQDEHYQPARGSIALQKCKECRHKNNNSLQPETSNESPVEQVEDTHHSDMDIDGNENSAAHSAQDHQSAMDVDTVNAPADERDHHQRSLDARYGNHRPMTADEAAEWNQAVPSAIQNRNITMAPAVLSSQPQSAPPTTKAKKKPIDSKVKSGRVQKNSNKKPSASALRAASTAVGPTFGASGRSVNHSGYAVRATPAINPRPFTAPAPSTAQPQPTLRGYAPVCTAVAAAVSAVLYTEYYGAGTCFACGLAHGSHHPWCRRSTGNCPICRAQNGFSHHSECPNRPGR